MLLERRLRARATASPAKVAVEWEGRAWTYAKVEEEARRLAFSLVARESEAEDRIALLFRQDGPMVASIYGSWLAGLVAVPLDPLWPVARCREVVADTDPSLICGEAAFAGLAEQVDPGLGRWCDFENPGYEGHGAVEFGTHQPSGPAYILYTSGSSGRPKGVVQSRENVAWHAATYARSIRMRPEDRVSLLAPYTCDAAVMDIHGTLRAGATLCIYDPRGEGIAGLVSWLESSSVSILHTTPTLLRQVLRRYRHRLRIPHLRMIVLGGESVFSDDVESLYAVFPPTVELVNGFGPTECTMALQYRPRRESPLRSSRIPIGTAVPGVEVTLEPTAGAGADVGEIVLKSRRVALGYWRRPDLTRQAFGVVDQRVRRYRTGDLGTRSLDGSVVHLGRLDAQAKIRGYRVEPGEVETKLAAIPGVRQAAVTMKRSAEGMRLVAWIVRGEDVGLSAAELRRQAATRLPAYMVPSEFLETPDLPLTASGKVDRKRLEERARVRAAPTRSEAESLTESILLEVWRDLLNSQALSPLDDPFECGADSLMALEVSLRIEERVGNEIPVSWLFECRSIRELAVRIGQAPRARDGGIDLGPQTGTLPLMSTQRRYWEREAGENLGAALHVGVALELRGPLEHDALSAAWSRLVMRHDALRVCFAVEAGGPRQHVARPSPECTLAIHLDLEQPEIDRRVSDDMQRSFSLGRVPLFRARLYRQAPNRHLMTVVVHHLIMDARSRGILERDLFELYLAELSGHAAALERSTPYAEAVLRSVSAHLGGRPAAEQWWREQLQGRALRLPVDCDEASKCDPRGRVALSYGKEDAKRLRALCRRTRASLFMLASALAALVLCVWTGRYRFVITTDRVGRQTWAASTIGLFSDVLALAIDVNPSQSFAQLLQSIRATIGATQAPEHALPFSEIVDAVYPGKLGSYDDLFPVAVFVESPRAPRRVGDALVVHSLELEPAEISRDLMLVASDELHETTFVWLYRHGRISRDRAEELGRHLRELLAKVLEDEHRTIASMLAS